MTTRTPTRWWLPSIADCLGIALTVWLLAFSLASEGIGLLHDVNAGYHIRTGDYLLEHRAMPVGDVFSFSKYGVKWYAWEWLCALLFSVVQRGLGFKGLMLLASAVIVAANLISLRYMIWRGANALAAIVLLHVVIGASSIHYFARPHVFSLLFMAISVWLLDRDRRDPTPWVWSLVPLTALWVNLHGAFLALLITLAIYAAGSALEAMRDPGRWVFARRYTLLFGASALASAVNPYGFHVHAHAVRFLSQKWLLNTVQEYRAPDFRSPESMYFEVLFIATVAISVVFIARGEIAPALVALAWGHAGLTSVRHIPIFALVAAPLVAEEATRLWNRFATGQGPRSIAGIFIRIAEDFKPHLARSSVWLPVFFVTLLCFDFGVAWPQDFPVGRVLGGIAEKHAELISTSRIFTTDSWADYLTYRLYPRQRIFVDGRADFFGEAMFEEYQRVLRGHHGWDAVLAKYGMNVALAPSGSAIASLLRTQAGWRLIEDSGDAALFRRE